MHLNGRLNKRLTGILTLAGLSFLFLTPAFAHPGRFSNWPMGHWMSDGWAMGGIGMIFMLLFWGLIIAGIVFAIRWLVRNTGGRTSGAGTESRALDILKERFAKGEIDRDEFESMKKELLG
jgi:putative membrane protein